MISPNQLRTVAEILDRELTAARKEARRREAFVLHLTSGGAVGPAVQAAKANRTKARKRVAELEALRDEFREHRREHRVAWTAEAAEDRRRARKARGLPF